MLTSEKAITYVIMHIVKNWVFSKVYVHFFPKYKNEKIFPLYTENNSNQIKQKQKHT